MPMYETNGDDVIMDTDTTFINADGVRPGHTTVRFVKKPAQNTTPSVKAPKRIEKRGGRNRLTEEKKKKLAPRAAPGPAVVAAAQVALHRPCLQVAAPNPRCLPVHMPAQVPPHCAQPQVALHRPCLQVAAPNPRCLPVHMPAQVPARCAQPQVALHKPCLQVAVPNPRCLPVHMPAQVPARCDQAQVALHKPCLQVAVPNPRCLPVHMPAQVPARTSDGGGSNNSSSSGGNNDATQVALHRPCMQVAAPTPRSSPFHVPTHVPVHRDPIQVALHRPCMQVAAPNPRPPPFHVPTHIPIPVYRGPTQQQVTSTWRNMPKHAIRNGQLVGIRAQQLWTSGLADCRKAISGIPTGVLNIVTDSGDQPSDFYMLLTSRASVYGYIKDFIVYPYTISDPDNNAILGHIPLGIGVFTIPSMPTRVVVFYPRPGPGYNGYNGVVFTRERLTDILNLRPNMHSSTDGATDLVLRSMQRVLADRGTVAGTGGATVHKLPPFFDSACHDLSRIAKLRSPVGSIKQPYIRPTAVFQQSRNANGDPMVWTYLTTLKQMFTKPVIRQLQGILKCSPNQWHTDHAGRYTVKGFNFGNTCVFVEWGLQCVYFQYVTWKTELPAILTEKQYLMPVHFHCPRTLVAPPTVGSVLIHMPAQVPQVAVIAQVPMEVQPG